MAIQIDKGYEVQTLGKQLKKAQTFVPNDPRAFLEVTDLPKPPIGIEGETRAFVFDRVLTTVYANEGGIVRKIALHGPINGDQRQKIAEALGLDPENSIRKVVMNYGGFPSKIEYTLPKPQQEGGAIQ